MRIVLIGFMGAGKSSVGKLVAEKLKFSFVEMDDEVIHISGYRSIPEIFALKGEVFFRELETTVTLSLKEKTNVVIATGGGAPCRPENMANLTSPETITIFLNVDFAVAKARIGNDNQRPLWQDLKKTQALFKSRVPLYRSESELELDANQPCQVIAERICQLVQQRRNPQ